MRRHAVVGSRILQGAPFSDAVKDGVRHVHEWWNGSGYPDGLRGERIPLFARILAVARPALPPAPVQIVLVARPVGRS